MEGKCQAGCTFDSCRHMQAHAGTAFLQIHQIPWGHCLLDSNDQRKFACDSSVALSECLRCGKLAELGCGK